MFNAIGFAFCFIFGILIMGSDGVYFPFINILGAIIFVGCLYFGKRI